MSKQSASSSDSESSKNDNVQQISDAAASAANAAGREAKSQAANALISLRKSARFAWHTWLGATITAEEFAVNATKGFAERGAEFDRRAREKLTKRVDKATKSTEGLRKQARQGLTNVENLIDRGANRSLHFFGVPTRSDVNQLTDLIQELAESVNELAEKTGGIPTTNKENGRSKKTSATTPA
jgi:polyhydroxyalkanoate synthesis regulator phasin